MMDPAARDSLPGGYGELLLSSFLVLILVCILIWAVGRFGVGRWRSFSRGRSHGPIHVVARAPLDVGLGLYLVEVAGQALLLGAGDGQLTLLRDLGPVVPPDEIPDDEFPDDGIPGNGIPGSVPGLSAGGSVARGPSPGELSPGSLLPGSMQDVRSRDDGSLAARSEPMANLAKDSGGVG